MTEQVGAQYKPQRNSCEVCGVKAIQVLYLRRTDDPCLGIDRERTVGRCEKHFVTPAEIVQMHSRFVKTN